MYFVLAKILKFAKLLVHGWGNFVNEANNLKYIVFESQLVIPPVVGNMIVLS